MNTPSPELIDDLKSLINGTLHTEKAGKLIESIQKDPHVKNEYELLKQEHLIIKEKAKEHLKEKAKLLLVESSQSKVEQSFKLIPLQFFKIAAAVIVLAAMLMVWRFSQQSLSPEKLFSKYYDQPIPSMPRSGEASSIERFRSALTAIEKGDYEMALQGFMLLSEDTISTVSIDQVLLFKGVSYLELGDQENAISSWSDISNISSYYVDAQWYSALVHLKMGNLTQAEKILVEMSGKSGKFRKQATEILNDMK